MRKDILVNRKHAVSKEDIEQFEFATTQDKNNNLVYIEQETLEAYNNLKTQLNKLGVFIDINSAFRSLEDQERVFDYITKKFGKDYAEKHVAPVGHSEHHTGLAIDIHLKRNDLLNKPILRYLDRKYSKDKSKFEEVLPEHGFILRYPEGKEHITEFDAEPWHIRYVGKEIAKEIAENNLTLEEYIELTKRLNQSEPSIK